MEDQTVKRCPRCRRPMKKTNFRTGSISQPGTPVDSCDECSIQEPITPPQTDQKPS